MYIAHQPVCSSDASRGSIGTKIPCIVKRHWNISMHETHGFGNSSWRKSTVINWLVGILNAFITASFTYGERARHCRGKRWENDATMRRLKHHSGFKFESILEYQLYIYIYIYKSIYIYRNFIQFDNVGVEISKRGLGPWDQDSNKADPSYDLNYIYRFPVVQGLKLGFKLGFELGFECRRSKFGLQLGFYSC